ncbi:hypothetical protein J4220_00995, partial [Candidatus Micrarchaeota archaeon]|nr:hypothetical protein [Candidatus Micrarchaeota archaeon]
MRATPRINLHSVKKQIKSAYCYFFLVSSQSLAGGLSALAENRAKVSFPAVFPFLSWKNRVSP